MAKASANSYCHYYWTNYWVYLLHYNNIIIATSSTSTAFQWFQWLYNYNWLVGTYVVPSPPPSYQPITAVSPTCGHTHSTECRWSRRGRFIWASSWGQVIHCNIYSHTIIEPYQQQSCVTKYTTQATWEPMQLRPVAYSLRNCEVSVLIFCIKNMNNKQSVAYYPKLDKS